MGLFRKKLRPPEDTHSYVASELFAKRPATEALPYGEGFVCVVCGNLQDTHKR